MNKADPVSPIRRPPPLACTERDKVNRMLGGDYGFTKLLEEAEKQKVKVILDAFTRISSSRAHRRYRD